MGASFGERVLKEVVDNAVEQLERHLSFRGQAGDVEEDAFVRIALLNFSPPDDSGGGFMASTVGAAQLVQGALQPLGNLRKLALHQPTHGAASRSSLVSTAEHRDPRD